MTFDEILEHTIELLRRQGRVSYRALKVRFALDDDHLEALKDELIYAQHVAVDEGGNVLAWVGGAAATPESSASASQPAQQRLSQADQSAQVEPPPPASSTPDAERRQLTVEFCDLVGSTALSGQLDPEDLREVVQAYQAAAAEVIQRYDGHLAQYLGDGLLIYSGYPQAHEDDAHRAVWIGLGIVEAIAHLNARLAPQYGVRLAVRVGIHTGPVVVGEMGGGGHHEPRRET
ncbi:MAG: adenylate/guanylate cyclase domain-containing protein [Chloroflexi bacterium]|nr:adenylate/guanylate cyclase domain-containing protein [Chloroflexota bacterium]